MYLSFMSSLEYYEWMIEWKTERDFFFFCFIVWLTYSKIIMHGIGKTVGKIHKFLFMGGL